VYKKYANESCKNNNKISPKPHAKTFDMVIHYHGCLPSTNCHAVMIVKTHAQI